MQEFLGAWVLRCAGQNSGSLLWLADFLGWSELKWMELSGEVCTCSYFAFSVAHLRWEMVAGLPCWTWQPSNVWMHPALATMSSEIRGRKLSDLVIHFKDFRWAETLQTDRFKRGFCFPSFRLEPVLSTFFQGSSRCFIWCLLWIPVSCPMDDIEGWHVDLEWNPHPHGDSGFLKYVQTCWLYWNTHHVFTVRYRTFFFASSFSGYIYIYTYTYFPTSLPGLSGLSTLENEFFFWIPNSKNGQYAHNIHPPSFPFLPLEICDYGDAVIVTVWSWKQRRRRGEFRRCRFGEDRFRGRL